MIEPSIYLYIIFIFLLYKLVKKGYWQQSFTDILETIKNNYLKLLLFILFDIGIVLFFDWPIISFFRDNKFEVLNWISVFGNSLGDGEILFSSLAVIIVVSVLLKWEKVKVLFSISFMSAVYSGIAVNILKIIFSRSRPNYHSNPFEFFKYIQAINEGEFASHVYASMPSGHTITSFALIIPFVLYFKNKYLKILLFLIGSSTAFARVYSNVHWPSDVLMGAVLGSLIASVIYKNNRNRLEID